MAVEVDSVLVVMVTVLRCKGPLQPAGACSSAYKHSMLCLSACAWGCEALQNETVKEF